MPMTLAHPAAVLSLGWLGLPMAALVIGSMTPDLPVFVQDWEAYHVTHGLVGVLTFDLAATLAVLLVWDRVVRDALVDLSPDVVRLRLPARKRLDRRAWLLAPLAAWLGSATHVFWDTFTHPGRWGVQQVGWLHEPHGPLLGHQWAQHVSGLLGLAVVLLVASARILSAPIAPDRPARALPVWVLPALLLAAAGYALLSGLGRRDEGLEALAFQGAVGGIVGSAAAVLAAGLLWSLASVRSRSEIGA